MKVELNDINGNPVSQEVIASMSVAELGQEIYEQLVADGFSNASIYNLACVEDGLAQEGFEVSEEVQLEVYEITQGLLEHSSF